MLNPFAIAGKRILVTGASSGIGRATAIACSQMGAEMYVTGRNPESLSITADLMNGNKSQTIVADLLLNEHIEALMNEIPVLDGVVFNAGINRRMLTKYVKELALDEILATNLKAPIMLAKSLLKYQKLSNGASLVFVSSIAAYHSAIGDGVYSASKGGLSSFSKVLALELAPRKVRVNTIQPGMVRTNLIENGPLSDADYAKDEARYPLGRYGLPQEVAHAAIYLLSDASRWVTGTDLVIDGGISLI